MSYKTKDINPILMSQYNAMLKLTEFEDKSEIKDKLAKFIDATCINDAKKVLKEIFPQSEGKSAFIIDGVEFFVCIKDNLFRICADFGDEFICHEFNK